MKLHLTAAAAVLLWTAAATLLLFSSTDDNWRLSQAAMFVSTVATMPTLWLIGDNIMARHRRLLLRQMCEVVGRADAERDSRHLRSAGS